jgi:uncharacterized OsmC-like protein
MQHYQVVGTRLGPDGSVARTKQADLEIDTDPGGRDDLFNPAELLLAALAGCIIKGIERVAPMISFDFRGVEVEILGERQDAPPMLTSISYEIIVDTDESDRRLELLHTNVRKYGTVSNTLAAATTLTGTVRRKATVARGDPSRN